MNIVCVLYDDPVDGYPPAYPRDGVPEIASYPDGQTTPTPKAIDFTPGELLGCVSGELGLRPFLEAAGHTLIVTADKDGPGLRVRARAAGRRCRDLPAVLAGLPDRRADRQGAEPEARASPPASAPTTSTSRRRSSAGVTVAEVTYSNSISVAEHVVMMILGLVRNYIPSYQDVVEGGWNIADCAARSYDVEGMQVGTVAAGPHRLGGAAAAEAVRRRPPLHRPPPPAR